MFLIILYVALLIALWRVIHNKTLPKRISLGTLGAFIGIFFLLAALFSVGSGGYGSPLFLLVYSAPLGLFGPSGMIGTPLIWAFFGAIAGKVESKAVSKTLIALLAIHYVSIPILLSSSSEIWDADKIQEAFRSGGLILILSIPLYVLCNIFLIQRLLTSSCCGKVIFSGKTRREEWKCYLA